MADRTILGRDDQGRVIDVVVSGITGKVGGGQSHNHDQTYASVNHTHVTAARSPLPDIANLTGNPSPAIVRDKVNAILAALRAAGVIQ